MFIYKFTSGTIISQQASQLNILIRMLIQLHQKLLTVHLTVISTKNCVGKKKNQHFEFKLSICLKMITWWKQEVVSPWVAHLWKTTDYKAEMCSETWGYKGYGQSKAQLWLALSLREHLRSYTKLRWWCTHVASWEDRAVLWDTPQRWETGGLKRHGRRPSYALQWKDKTFTLPVLLACSKLGKPNKWKKKNEVQINYEANTKK